jgi:hypothetical protein
VLDLAREMLRYLQPKLKGAGRGASKLQIKKARENFTGMPKAGCDYHLHARSLTSFSETI